jgi:hypothetical protein
MPKLAKIYAMEDVALILFFFLAGVFHWAFDNYLEHKMQYKLLDEKPLQQRIDANFYDIHTGSIVACLLFVPLSAERTQAELDSLPGLS